MKKFILCKILIIFSLCFTSCYVESGYDISRKLEKKTDNLDGKYIIDCLGFINNRDKPTIDLFQKRGSNEFKEFRFGLKKNYSPEEKNINVDIKNSVYKLKKNENIFKYAEIRKFDNGLYYSIENNNLQRHYISDKERKLGLVGGYSFYLDFQVPVKARQLEYIEFDLSITDEEGIVHDYHLHYDIKIRPVFKIGSTLWEYWSSI